MYFFNVELCTTDQTSLLHSEWWCHLLFIAQYHVKKTLLSTDNILMAKAAILTDYKHLLTTSLHCFWSPLSPNMHIHNYKNILLHADTISALRLIYNVEIYSFNKWHHVCNRWYSYRVSWKFVSLFLKLFWQGRHTYRHNFTTLFFFPN